MRKATVIPTFSYNSSAQTKKEEGKCKMRSWNYWKLVLLLLVGLGNAHDPFYNGCGKDKSCWGMGRDRAVSTVPFDKCWIPGDCTVSLKVEPPKDGNPGFKFHLRYDSVNFAWGAIGISKAEKMSDLLVMECISDNNLEVPYAILSTTATNLAVPERIKPGLDLEESVKVPNTNTPFKLVGDHAVTYVKKFDEFTYALCEFTFPEVFSVKGFVESLLEGPRTLDFNLKKEEYFVYSAVGQTSPTLFHELEDVNLPKMNKHEQMGRTTEKFKLTDPQVFESPTSVILQNTHGTLMGIIYFVLLPVAITISRFFKETWSGKRVGRRRLWFALHVGIMISAFVLYLIAWLAILLDINEGVKGIKNVRWWPDSVGGHTHASFGVASFALFACQVIIPWLIPAERFPHLKDGHSFMHFAMGLICYGLGVYNILMSPVMMPHLVFCTVILVTSLWIASHFGIYVFLTNLLIIKDHEMVVNDQRFRAVTTYPMKVKTIDDAPGVKARTVLLIILILLGLAFSVMLSIQIGTNSECKMYLPNATEEEEGDSDDEDHDHHHR